MAEIETMAEAAPDIVFRYHETLAPKGERFYSDQLPSEDEGWYDTPARFSNYRPNIHPLDKVLEPREPPHECFRYHRHHPPQKFMSDALPSEDDGWFDSPAKCIDWEPSGQPVPAKFQALDDFMSAWVKYTIVPDMDNIAKGKAKKDGLALWAREICGVEVDTTENLPALLERVQALLPKEAEA